MSVLKKLDRYSEKGIITLFIITMSILIFIQVVSRYVFDNSFTWTEEISRYLFIWLIFLAIGIGFREDKHISIDFILDLLSPKIKKIVVQFNYIVLLLLSALFVWEGYVMVAQMYIFGQTSPNMGIPMWWVYLSLPVGFILAAIRLIQASVSLWTNKTESEGKS